MSGKIVISSSTKVSLNDRFTKLAQAKPKAEIPMARSSNSGQTLSNASKRSALDQATSQNKKLALQMSSRPSVQAALKLKNKSIKARIGQVPKSQQQNTKSAKPAERPNVKSRIDLAARLSLNGVPLRKNPAENVKRRLQLPAGKTNNIRRIGSGGAVTKNRNNKLNVSGSPNKRFNNSKGGQKSNNRTGQRKNGATSAEVKPKTKEGLDGDLDSYMAKSKGHLDNDLDTYMSQSGTV